MSKWKKKHEAPIVIRGNLWWRAACACIERERGLKANNPSEEGSINATLGKSGTVVWL